MEIDYFVGGVFATILTAVVLKMLKWILEEFIDSRIVKKQNPLLDMFRLEERIGAAIENHRAIDHAKKFEFVKRKNKPQ